MIFIAKQLSPVEQAKLKKIMSDPVLWAKAFLKVSDPINKKMGPWIARDYQAKMMRDDSIYKVYRCGRRIGKSETMIVEGLYKAYTKKKFRILYVTPYENQVNLIFMRMKEIIHDSPLVKNEISRMINSPYIIEFKNGSTIMGFTTGASSGQGAANVRGQRADWIFMDELDYMAEQDYSTVSMIAGERPDIGVTCSSTPTGKRGTFYNLCTKKEMGYSEHYHPSMDNPNWCKEMEDHYRAELTPSQYDHEILAIFGTEEKGVFDKEALDRAMKQEFYAYEPLNSIQQHNLEDSMQPTMYLYDEDNKAPRNIFRCVGVDFDKFAAGSSIIVLDFDVNRKKFKVIKRIEVPRGEYSLDNAVNWIIRVNFIYQPSWIFIDRGYGDYQLERLHLYGEDHPSTGLDKKVVGWQFKNTIPVMDPVTKETHKEPVKQFMVNQLSLSFERDRMILSPFDEVLHKQLIDYEVDHVSSTGLPIYTSKNEHFVDALGLAHLAFVLNFPDLTGAIKKPEFTTEIVYIDKHLGDKRANADLRAIANPWGIDRDSDPWQKLPGWESDSKRVGKNSQYKSVDYGYWTKVPLGRGKVSSGNNWGSRGGSFGGRSMW